MNDKVLRVGNRSRILDGARMNMRLILRQTVCRIFGHWWKRPSYTVIFMNSNDHYHYFKVCRICGVRRMNQVYTCSGEEANKKLVEIEYLLDHRSEL